MTTNKCNNFLALGVLVKRNIKLYMKDKMTVFFSLLAPIIVLVLYILFLGDLQVQNIMATIGDAVSETEVRALVNNWMISGVMGVSCVTVALNANIIMVRDRMSGNVNDIISSPVKRWVLYLSYIISCFIITFTICLIVLFLSIIYLACTGGLMMSFSDFLVILCVTAISVLSSAFFMVLICSFIKTTSALAALNGVFSTAIGFLIGAYLPFSMLPDYIQYIGCFIPGTYSASLFRNYFMGGVMEHLQGKIPPETLNQLLGDYSINLNLFGKTISPGWMVFAILVSIVLFAALLAIFYSNKKTNFFAMGRKIKLRKSKKAKNGEAK